MLTTKSESDDSLSPEFATINWIKLHENKITVCPLLGESTAIKNYKSKAESTWGTVKWNHLNCPHFFFGWFNTFRIRQALSIVFCFVCIKMVRCARNIEWEGGREEQIKSNDIFNGYKSFSAQTLNPRIYGNRIYCKKNFKYFFNFLSNSRLYGSPGSTFIVGSTWIHSTVAIDIWHWLLAIITVPKIWIIWFGQFIYAFDVVAPLRFLAAFKVLFSLNLCQNT